MRLEHKINLSGFFRTPMKKYNKMTDYIPPQEVFKFCPKCGSQQFKFQGEKSFLCNSCNFLYYINVAGAVAALILDDENRLLFAKRAFDPHKGTLDLPGGFVDKDESAEEALVREIKEELNLDVDRYTFFRSFPNRYTFRGLTYYTVDLFFKCTVKNMEKRQAGDDAAEIVFLPINEIDPGQIGLTSIRKVVGGFIESYHQERQ